MLLGRLPHQRDSVIACSSQVATVQWPGQQGLRPVLQGGLLRARLLWVACSPLSARCLQVDVRLPIVAMTVNWEKVYARLKSIFISQFLLISYVVAATIALAWPAPGKAVGSVQVGATRPHRRGCVSQRKLVCCAVMAMLEY